MNVRRLIITVVTILLLGTLFTAGFHSLAAAQNSIRKQPVTKENVNELPPEMVGKRASELLSRINETIASGKRYEKKMTGASEENRLVFQLQIYQMRIRIMDDIHQLADALLELEKAGPEPELREQVEDILARVTPGLWFHIDRFRGEINKIRARRIEAKAEERFAIENEVANFTRRLDTFYEKSLAHITKMEQVGMDVKEARENFIRQLYDRADELSGRLELALVRIDELETQLKEIPDDTNVFKLLCDSKKRPGHQHGRYGCHS